MYRNCLRTQLERYLDCFPHPSKPSSAKTLRRTLDTSDPRRRPANDSTGLSIREFCIGFAVVALSCEGRNAAGSTKVKFCRRLAFNGVCLDRLDSVFFES